MGGEVVVLIVVGEVLDEVVVLAVAVLVVVGVVLDEVVVLVVVGVVLGTLVSKTLIF